MVKLGRACRFIKKAVEEEVRSPGYNWVLKVAEAIEDELNVKTVIEHDEPDDISSIHIQRRFADDFQDMEEATIYSVGHDMLEVHFDPPLEAGTGNWEKAYELTGASDMIDTGWSEIYRIKIPDTVLSLYFYNLEPPLASFHTDHGEVAVNFQIDVSAPRVLKRGVRHLLFGQDFWVKAPEFDDQAIQRILQGLLKIEAEIEKVEASDRYRLAMEREFFVQNIQQKLEEQGYVVDVPGNSTIEHYIMELSPPREQILNFHYPQYLLNVTIHDFIVGEEWVTKVVFGQKYSPVQDWLVINDQADSSAADKVVSKIKEIMGPTIEYYEAQRLEIERRRSEQGTERNE